MRMPYIYSNENMASDKACCMVCAATHEHERVLDRVRIRLSHVQCASDVGAEEGKDGMIKTKSEMILTRGGEELMRAPRGWDLVVQKHSVEDKHSSTRPCPSDHNVYQPSTLHCWDLFSISPCEP